MENEETTEDTQTEAQEVEDTEAEVTDDTADEVEDEGEEPEESGFDPEKGRAKIRKINSENRNLRKRAAEAEAKAQEASEKGEKVTALEVENLKLRVALKHGLPEKLAARLTGSTEEELLEDAEDLMGLFVRRQPPTQQPKMKLRASGNSPDVDDGFVDPSKVVDEIFDN